MGSLFKSIQRNWSRHFISQVSALFILTVTYATAIFTVFASVSIKDAVYKWGKIGQATVYVKSNVPEKKIESIRKDIAKQPFVKSVAYISPKKSAENFEKTYKNLLPQGQSRDSIGGFFPSSFQISLKKSVKTDTDADQLQRFGVAMKQKFVEVEEVAYGQSWLYKYTKILDLFNNLALWVGLTLLFASLFVTSNVLKNVLFARKQEIEVLEMVGATPSWIFGPQVVNGLMLSGLSMTLALALNMNVFAQLSESFQMAFQQSVVQEGLFWLNPVRVLFLATGTLFAVFISTIFAIRSVHASSSSKKGNWRVFKARRGSAS